jgi:ATP-dependent DNA helicase RecG
MYPTYTVSDEQVIRVMQVKEDYLNDVKSKEIKPAKLSETVSAFANAAGGDIYIGICEVEKGGKKRVWDGFDSTEGANDIIQSLFNAHPFGNHLKFEFLENPNMSGYVLHITVRKVKEIVKSTSGEVFVRVGSGKVKIDTDEKLARLRLDKGIISFEDEWVEAPLHVVENSVAMIGFVLSVIPSSEPLVYLKNQELVKDGFAKVSGIILFADEPAVNLPKRCSIKILRYKTKDDSIGREFLDGQPLTIEGNAYTVIKEAVSKTKQIVETIKKLTPEGLEDVRYPDETLHEIVTNAVLHRDYSMASDVQIRIYDNRVEIESPGRLPGHVTVKNILDNQSARNPTIVRLINKFPDPPNKDVGEGLNTAFDAMRSLRLKDPIIEEKENTVLVTIRHEPLASPEQIVMEYLETHEEINNRTARELTGIKSENSMKNVFIRLKERGELEQIAGRMGSRAAWRKAKRS